MLVEGRYKEKKCYKLPSGLEKERASVSSGGALKQESHETV